MMSLHLATEKIFFGQNRELDQFMKNERIICEKYYECVLRTERADRCCRFMPALGKDRRFPGDLVCLMNGSETIRYSRFIWEKDMIKMRLSKDTVQSH